MRIFNIYQKIITNLSFRKINIILVVGLFINTSFLFGSDIIVSKDGTNSPGSSKFASLKYAISIAQDQDKIYLEEGIYTEHSIKINKDISIIGQKNNLTVVQGSTNESLATENIFEILPGKKVKFLNFTIQNGKSNIAGGAILNYGYLEMIGCELKNNHSEGVGGAIAILKGSLVISNCKISGNSAGSEGGGLYLNYGDLQMDNCQIDNNKSKTNGGGIKAGYSALNIDNSRIVNNNAENGSGLMLFSCGNIISESIIESNGSLHSINGGLNIITMDQDESTYIYSCSIKNNLGKDQKNDIYQIAYLKSKNYLLLQNCNLDKNSYFSEEIGGSNIVVNKKDGKFHLLESFKYKTLAGSVEETFIK